MINPDHIQSYPMGPKVRAFFAISDDNYRGETDPLYDETYRKQFADYFLSVAGVKSDLSLEALTDLIDELTSMDLPEVVIGLVGQRPELLVHRDFRCQLGIGVAAMLTENYDLSEDALRSAQEMLPAEPAPYINIVQILFAQSRLDEALVWCESGLEAEPNNHSLWELMTRLREVTDGEAFPDMIMRLATRFNSWAGLSLAASLSTSGDRYLKVNLLEKLYTQGERSDQFLIEYTAALGVAGDMERIPQIIWLEETSKREAMLSWQLYLHAAQAYLAMDKFEEALTYIEKSEKQKYIPDEARAAIDELRIESHQGMGKLHLS
jgi:tetratricopeptide (TPR) repeat protein